MFCGEHSLHSFLERSFWHSAQHTRQLLWWPQQNGLAIERQLMKELLGGLPMPQGLWE
jgi:hypothetical protein